MVNVSLIPELVEKTGGVLADGNRRRAVITAPVVSTDAATAAAARFVRSDAAPRRPLAHWIAAGGGGTVRGVERAKGRSTAERGGGE
jgi:hypothetical protein